MRTFVTIGTSASFDSLIEEVDRLVGIGSLDNVMIQLGNGEYIPNNIPTSNWFRFSPSIEQYLQEAELVICHTGATIFEVLDLGKKLIVVHNDKTVEANKEVATKFHKSKHLIFCESVKELEDAVKKSESFVPKPFIRGMSEIPFLIKRHLEL